MSAAVARTHSTWLHLVKQPRYFAAVDEVREPQSQPERDGTWNGAPGAERSDGVSRDRGWQASTIAFNPLGKLPGSVWTMPEQEAVERIVKGWSPEGAVVIDPFCTTRPR